MSLSYATIAVGTGDPVAVPFNPASLRVTTTNQIGDAKPSQVSKPTAFKLDVELLFDSTQDGADIFQKTRALRDAATASGKGATKASSSGAVNELAGAASTHLALVKFAWGSTQYQGYIESLSETLDYWSSDGVPLRSTIQISLKGTTDNFLSGKLKGIADNVSNPAPPPLEIVAIAKAADPAPYSFPQNQGGDGSTGRGIAAFNGVENMRGGVAFGVGVGAGVAAGAGFGAGAGLSVGAGAGIAVGGGAQLQAAAGFKLAGGISAGAAVGFGIGASAGLSIGAGLSASVGIGMAAGGGIGIGAGIGIGVGGGIGGAAGFGASGAAVVGGGSGAAVGLVGAGGFSAGGGAVGSGLSFSSTGTTGFDGVSNSSTTTTAGFDGSSTTTSTTSVSSGGWGAAATNSSWGSASAGLPASAGAFAGLGASRTTLPGIANPAALLPPPLPGGGVTTIFDVSGRAVGSSGQVGAGYAAGVVVW